MLGTRGCRLGLHWPEIYEMQVRAIVRAAKAVEQRRGVAPRSRSCTRSWLRRRAERLRELTERTGRERRDRYLCGTMIELPRACVCAGEIAAHADFFSFGTNDLTQTRSASLATTRRKVPHPLPRGANPRHDPFETLDQAGVGELMRSRSNAAVPPGRGCGSASAASTAVIPLRSLLPSPRARLRLLLSLPRADRTSGAAQAALAEAGSRRIVHAGD